jgi:hypothetical protein
MEASVATVLLMSSASWNGIAMATIDLAKKHVTQRAHADVGLRICDYPTIQVCNYCLTHYYTVCLSVCLSVGVSAYLSIFIYLYNRLCIKNLVFRIILAKVCRTPMQLDWWYLTLLVDWTWLPAIVTGVYIQTSPLCPGTCNAYIWRRALV